MSSNLQPLLYVSPVLFYSAAIMYVAAQPDAGLPDELFQFGDKINHIGAFCVSVPIAHRAFSWIVKQGRNGSPMLLALIWSFLFGLLIEVVQSFVPGRSGDWMDLLADVLGILLGAAFTTLLLKSKLKSIVRFEG